MKNIENLYEKLERLKSQVIDFPDPENYEEYEEQLQLRYEIEDTEEEIKIEKLKGIECFE